LSSSFPQWCRRKRQAFQ